jgi:hypothetical protein
MSFDLAAGPSAPAALDRWILVGCLETPCECLRSTETRLSRLGFNAGPGEFKLEFTGDKTVAAQFQIVLTRFKVHFVKVQAAALQS